MALDESPNTAAEPPAGTTLRELIAGKPVEQRRALRIIRQVLEALATTHAANKAHGNVRPENIVVTTALGKDTVTLGAAGGAAQKSDPVYRAPEAAIGPPNARADVYAVGAVLYETLTGRPPFVADDAEGLRRLHAYAPLQPLKQRTPGVAYAESLEKIVATALAKKRDSRFASATAMIEAVDGALAEIEAATPEPPPTQREEPANDSLRLLAQDLMPPPRESEPSLPVMPVNVSREVPELPLPARAKQSVTRALERTSARLRIPRRALVGALAAAFALALVSIAMCSRSSTPATPRSGREGPAAATTPSGRRDGSASPSGRRDESATAPTAATSLPARCVLLARACGAGEKRVAKLTAECNAAAEKQVERGCAAKAIAAYDCYQRNLCGHDDPVWALDDLRVLSARNHACVNEADALRACVDAAQR